MKLEDKDLIELVTDGNYQIIVEKKRIGIQPNRPAIFFPGPIDHFLHNNCDDKGVYWVPYEGNERVYAEMITVAFENQKKDIFFRYETLACEEKQKVIE